jgi:hypothetical protein
MLEKESYELVREYAQQWREKVVKVDPPLLEKEMINLFSNTFKDPYPDHLIGATTQHFTNIVVERIKQAIRVGRIDVRKNKEDNEVHQLRFNQNQPRKQWNNRRTPMQPHRHPQHIKKALPPLPLPLKKMFEKLVSMGQITLISHKLFRSPYQKWYEPNHTCEYHNKAMGHNIENYHYSKDKLFQLIEARQITFEG